MNKDQAGQKQEQSQFARSIIITNNWQNRRSSSGMLGWTIFAADTWLEMREKSGRAGQSSKLDRSGAERSGTRRQKPGVRLVRLSVRSPSTGTFGSQVYCMVATDSPTYASRIHSRSTTSLAYSITVSCVALRHALLGEGDSEAVQQQQHHSK
jgi:hypothetical protein